MTPQKTCLQSSREYFDSGCEEVWLVFPESRRVLVMTQERTLAFAAGDVAIAQLILKGFKVAVHDFLA